MQLSVGKAGNFLSHPCRKRRGLAPWLAHLLQIHWKSGGRRALISVLAEHFPKHRCFSLNGACWLACTYPFSGLTDGPIRSDLSPLTWDPCSLLDGKHIFGQTDINQYYRKMFPFWEIPQNNSVFLALGLYN